MTGRDEQLLLDFLSVDEAFKNCEDLVITRHFKGLVRKCSITFNLNGYIKPKDGTPSLTDKHRVDVFFPITYPRTRPIVRFLTPTYHPYIINGILKAPKDEIYAKSLPQFIEYIGDVIRHAVPLNERVPNKEAQKWFRQNRDTLPTDNPIRSQPVAIEQTEPNGVCKVSFFAKLERPICRLRLTKPIQLYIKSGFCLRTVMLKSVFWAMIGTILAFSIIQFTAPITNNRFFAWQDEYYELAEYFKYADEASDAFSRPTTAYRQFCADNGLSYTDNKSFIKWYIYGADADNAVNVESYLINDQLATEALNSSFENEFEYDYKKLETTINSITIMSEAIPIIIFTTLLTFFICFGEGIYYGSRLRALRDSLLYSVLACVLSIGCSVVSEWFYIILVTERTAPHNAAIIRALGVATIGAIVGFCTSLSKPKYNRLTSATFFATAVAFFIGLFYNMICTSIYSHFWESAVIYLLLGLCISLAIGASEQLCKKGWFREIKHGRLKKEYILSSRKTRFGLKAINNVILKNASEVAGIHFVVFYDKGKFIMIDRKSRFGTKLNGETVTHGILKNGDIIKIGNKSFRFFTK